MAFARRPTVLERLIVELGAEVDTSKLSEFEKATERVMEKADRAAKVVMGIGAAATAALTAAAVAFSGVEAQLAEVAAKTGLTVEHLKDTYSEALRAIQRETGLADRQLLDALQKAISAGLEDQEAIDAVAESARAAAARIGEISDQVSAATTIMGAFEVSAGTALDVVARAAQVGEGETEDFANSLKGLGALGESIGLGLYDVAGGLAAISRSAKSVSEGETQLKAFIASMSGRSRVGAKLLDDLGLSFEALRKIGENEGLAAMVGTLKRAVGDDIETLNRIVGSSEALQFVLNTDVSALEALTADIEQTAPGTIGRAFAEGADLSARKLEQLREGVKNVFEDVGRYIDPIAGRILDLGLKLTDAFLALPDGLKRATAYGGVLLATLLPLGGVARIVLRMRRTSLLLGTALESVAGAGAQAGEALAGRLKGSGKEAKALRGRLAGLSRLLPAVLNPVGLIVAGIASLALVAAKWDEIETAARSAWSALTDYFSASRRNREIASGRLEAQDKLVGTLRSQLEILQEQGAAAGVLAEKEAEIADAVARRTELEGRVRAGEVLRELDVAQDVLLPELAGQFNEIAAERAKLERRLETGFSGEHSLAVPMTDSQRATVEARLAALDTDEALARAELETLRLQAEVGLSAIAETDDARLIAAGAASYRTFAEGIRSAAPGLAVAVEDTLEDVFGPRLPSSDAVLGPLSRLTEAGRAVLDTMAAGIRSRGTPLADAVADALQFPSDLPELSLPELEQTISRVLGTVAELPELETLREIAAKPEDFRLPVPPPPDYFGGWAPGEAGAPGASPGAPRHFALRIDKIEINAPGADAEEIMREIEGRTARQWEELVEQADSMERT